MGKERKTKKGNREEESDDEGSLPSKGSLELPLKTKKKGRRAKDFDSDDENDKGDENADDKESISSDKKTKEIKKKKDKKKSKGASARDDSDENDNLSKHALASDEEIPEIKKKKSKKALLDNDDEEDALPEVKSKAKMQKPKSGFELLDDEGGMDVDMDSGEDDASKEEISEEVKPEMKKESKQKKSKKDKKKKTEEDEELDKMLAEIELGDVKKSKKKKEKEVREEVEEKGVEIVTEIPEDEEEEKPKKKKKKKKDQEEQTTAKEQPGDEEKDKDDEGEEGSTVKTAAQKKKEKKERERQKKLLQKSQEKGKKTEKVEPAGDEKKPRDSISMVKTESLAEKLSEELDEVGIDDDDETGKKKTDKKKKKDKGEKDEKDKKRPGKKQILAMQEALKKLKEEEEKARLEEEAKQRAAEEAENLRLEKLRIEQEKKERRKQKEKEKRERLKAEGKLLSQAQKQARARAQAMLESLRAQGIDVPQIGEKKERTPRPGDRIRPKKTKASSIEEQTKVVTIEPSSECLPTEVKPREEPVSPPVPQEEEVKESWEEESDEDVKDAWDISSSEEDEDVNANDTLKTTKKPTKPAAKKSRDSVGESSSECESDSEESESESEEESSSESEESQPEDEKPLSEKIREKALLRIQKRREENEKNRSLNKLRSPVVCVLGHVDTGKTKILDKIRRSHVQDSEAGGITQQIGATMVPMEAIREQSKMAKGFNPDAKIPGLLIIDTPGHESFSNLRSRGSSLCDIAILVVDIMHGLEPQTIESINLLKQRKTPFVVALNKIDRLYEWKPNKHKDIQDTLKAQNRNTQLEFEERVRNTIVQFAEQSLNAKLFYENTDPRTYISLIPTSAHSGDGMGNLMALIVELTQTMMSKQITFTEELQCTVLEVKAIPGLGTTIDVILVNGRLREGQTIVLAGTEGALVTQIRSLLMPQPLKELRVKNPYQEFKEVEGAQGIKVTGKDLEKSIAGLNLLVAHHPDEVNICKEEVEKELHAAMSSIKCADRGVMVQASTLGSLEALLEFLRQSKIPYSGIRIGPVVKKDVTRASAMLEHDSQYAVILAFDVKTERDAQDLADNLGVKIFSADIIYHLFDKFMAYREELKQKKRDQFKNIAVFPCKLRILPQFIFNTRDPIVVGVSVEAGIVKEGTPLCVPSKDFLEIGVVSTIELNHKNLERAVKGQEVCIKIEAVGGDAPKLYGRHFDHTDPIVSKITRQSIDACKEYFRDDLQKCDWQLMVELKKLLQIV